MRESNRFSGIADLFLVVALVCVAVLAPPRAAYAQSVEAQFRTWLEREIRPEAAKLGVSRATFDAALGKVTPDLELPDLVMPGQKPKTPQKQHQAEFRSPANYFSEKTLGGVVAGGRSRLGENAAILARIEKATGVPGRIAVAIWGRESGFGRAKIPHDAFRVLATKAFLSTRKEMFRAELLAALVMVEKRGVPASAMKSSWAGALGQPQFLPTSYLEHAADGDGDGRADIWNSQADTLASIANYLRKKGWVAGRDWGFEVSVPDAVSCSLEGPDQGRRIADWEKLGIRRINGRPFPAHEAAAEGYLLMPAGRYGPAFIVTPNFYVLKSYNESDLYALFIGHAGDRIQYGGQPFAGEWTTQAGMKRSQIAAMQRALEKQGHDVGGADGLPGFKTRRSIGRWQEAQGRPAKCFPDTPALQALGG
jgi:lytic murein transglycosylase